MKFLKKSFFMIFLFSISFQHLRALCGTTLCDYVLNNIEKFDVHPLVQQLVSNGTNSLPYNIIVNFSHKATQTNQTNDNLILFFEMEECEQNLEIFDSVFKALKEQDFDSTVVFCYGNKTKLPRQNIIYGAEIFAQSLNSTVNNAVILFSLGAKKNSIVTGSNRSHAPSWMLKDLFDAYSNAHMTEGLPLFFMSQISDYTFSDDKSFLAFIDANIPCIHAGMKNEQKYLEVILSCINSYKTSRYEPNDSHNFMFRIFGKRIWFSELRLINLLIVILILSFIFVFAIGFVNKSLKKEFWNEIGTNWYVIPVIFALSVLGFFTGKLIYTLTVPAGKTAPTVYGFIILQISISMFLVSVFFMLNLSILKKYTTRSLDFILVIDTFINLCIFTLYDISLFPLFVLIFIISVISLIFRRNWIHIILFVFLSFPFAPYINALFDISDAEKLHEMLLKSTSQPFIISLILIPLYLMWLRILNAMKKHYAKKRLYALALSSTYIFIIVLLSILNKAFYPTTKKTDNSISVMEIENAVDSADFENFSQADFELTYSDKRIFADFVRTINVRASQIPVYVSLKVESDDNITPPVLYSENEFSSELDGAAIFSLPVYPPQNLIFSYGCGNSTQSLKAEVIFYEPEQKVYYSVKKTLLTEGKK